MTGKKIFLDVGAHQGETLEHLVTGEHLFDEIHCFEPMPEPFQILNDRFGSHAPPPAIHFHMFGLASFSGEKNIYGENLGASLFADREGIDPDLITRCRFRRASDFFRDHIAAEDLVIMKLNVEGAEIMIMHDLLDSGEAAKIKNVMIDFDIFDVPSEGKDAAKALVRRFKREGFRSYSTARLAMLGRRGDNRTRNWLASLPFAKELMRAPPSLPLHLKIAKWRRFLMRTHLRRRRWGVKSLFRLLRSAVRR